MIKRWKGYPHFDGRQIYIFGDDTDRVAFVPLHASRKAECQQRARLIEHAPELYESLRWALDKLIAEAETLTAPEREGIEILLQTIKGKD